MIFLNYCYLYNVLYACFRHRDFDNLCIIVIHDASFCFQLQLDGIAGIRVGVVGQERKWKGEGKRNLGRSRVRREGKGVGDCERRDSKRGRDRRGEGRGLERETGSEGRER